MRTQKQIEASRANGKKSRGPVSDQGKACLPAIPSSTDRNPKPSTLTTNSIRPSKPPQAGPHSLPGLHRQRRDSRPLLRGSISRLKPIQALEASSLNDEIARLAKADPGFADVSLNTRICRPAPHSLVTVASWSDAGNTKASPSAHSIPPANTSKNCAANGF